MIDPIKIAQAIERETAQFQSCWEEGAKAARAGKPASACPHKPLKYEFVTWHNGWVYAMHLKAKEDDEI